MKIREERIRNIVIGSGAAGFQAALRLVQNNETDTAIVTENVKAGTSRNTGSDKQTYYKLSLASGDPDSVLQMAEDLFAGQCVDGDMALCEAALSTRAFFRLVELGVPFPCTEYGEFMGYKTDHDRGRRATSAGPYTSRLMTECLEQEAARCGVRILNGLMAIRLLVHDGRIRGVLCLDRTRCREEAGVSGDTPEPKPGRAQLHDLYRILWAENVILATGGPAGMYRDSVYPVSQFGASGLAFEAGAAGKNLTEWQFGLASLSPRWNVSGTYMQVLPRFISTAPDGSGAKEFLMDYFATPQEMLSMVFLKGYQWPFDVQKIFGGSSIIDLLVYQETVLRGRRVFLDFSENPCGQPVPFEKLAPEAYAYLRDADALFGTPIERLARMNRPAIDFYLDHHVDLSREMLEIAVCAQHNNGGIATDAYWETEIRGLFAIGEACGSHGVTRPGGSALNAGQVGAMRAAERIRLRRTEKNEADEAAVRECRKEAERFARLPLQELAAEQAGDRAGGGEENPDRAAASREEPPAETLDCAATSREESPAEAFGCAAASRGESPAEAFRRAARRMSDLGGMIRSREGLEKALRETEKELVAFPRGICCRNLSQLPLFFRLRETLLTQKVYLSAMLDYLEQGGGSRGSALYTDPTGEKPDPRLPELFRCTPDNGRHGNVIQEVRWSGTCTCSWRPVRPIPEVDYFFENQWRLYRERMEQRCSPE